MTTRGARRRLGRLARAAYATTAATAVGTLLVLAPAAPAVAHTDLVSSSPADGTTVSSAPKQIVLRFNEEIARDLAVVTVSIDGAEPRRLPVEPAGSATDVVAAVTGLPGSSGSSSSSGSGSGAVDWAVAYRVTSGDGHPVEGQLAFRAPVPHPAPTATGPAASPDSSTSSDTQSTDASTTDSVGGTDWSTLVIAAVTAVGVAIGCGWLIRARKRAGDS